MWKRKLCLATSGQFARPVEEQIRLFAATGFEGFFTGWTPDEDIAHYAAIARAENMLYQSIHAPFTRMAEMWQDGERGDGALAELIDCLRVCADNAVPVMVAHAFIGFKDHAPTEIGVEQPAVKSARAGTTSRPTARRPFSAAAYNKKPIPDNRYRFFVQHP